MYGRSGHRFWIACASCGSVGIHVLLGGAGSAGGRPDILHAMWAVGGFVAATSVELVVPWSFGKRLVSIEIVRLNGGRATTGRRITRWLIKWSPVLIWLAGYSLQEGLFDTA